MSRLESYHSKLISLGNESVNVQRRILDEACRRVEQETGRASAIRVIQQVASAVQAEIGKMPDEKAREKMREFWHPILQRIRNIQR